MKRFTRSLVAAFLTLSMLTIAIAAPVKTVRHAFLIGDAQEDMAAWLEKKKIPVTRSGTLEKAVKSAHTLAQNERLSHAVVLLSPACASFDQFKDFEHRGEVFTELVKNLTQAPLTSKGAHA